MACYHIKMHHPHAAIKCLEKAFAFTPTDQQVCLNMCNALSSLGRFERAAEFADLALLNAEPKNKPVCLYSKGVQYEYMGKLDRAY
jgi:tetratricopeptide (TPR) repeat protein